MNRVKLYPFQYLRDAVVAIQNDDNFAGYVPKQCGYFLVIIDQLEFGMIRVQDVGEDKYVNWQTEVPFSNTDTVGYLLQRAQIKAGI